MAGEEKQWVSLNLYPLEIRKERTQGTSGRLVSQTSNHLRLGSNKDDARILTLLGKLCVFRQEAVPGMDHVDPVLESDPDDVVLGEVGGHGGQALTDLISFIGLKRIEWVKRG